MDFYTKIKQVYPDLDDVEFLPERGKIELLDDGDGIQYIAKWEYSKPIPAGLKLGKD